MKVLQLTKFYPPVTGGIESVTYEIAEGLNAAGASCDVLCANTEAHTVREWSPNGYRVTRAGLWGRLLSTSIAPALIVETWRRRYSYDVIHLHLPDPLTSLAVFMVRPSCKVVVHWHNDIVRQKAALRFFAPLQQWLLRRADAIIATSTPYADSSPWLKPFKDKIAVIPVGIRDARTPEAEEEADRIRQRYGNRQIVFACGRMTYYKGFDFLIEAAREFPESCVVVIAGGGELLETYRDKVRRLKLESRVVLLGAISHEETAAYYIAATLFCLPSTNRAESFGVVLLEAMAMGTPIVSTEISGSAVPWLNQHGTTGLNVPPGDSSKLATAICYLLSKSDLRHTMGIAARSQYAKYFTASVMVAAIGDLYRRLLTFRASTEPSSIDVRPR